MKTTGVKAVVSIFCIVRTLSLYPILKNVLQRIGDQITENGKDLGFSL